MILNMQQNIVEKYLNVKLRKTKKSFLIDSEDLLKISKYSWTLQKYKRKNKYSYYIRTVHKGKLIMLQNLILSPKKGKIVDHINRNGLDNRKENLRQCTFQENSWNKELPVGKSGYRGVSFNKQLNRYVARITKNKKTYLLGYFSDPKEAAIVRNKAAKKLHKKFAILNKI